MKLDDFTLKLRQLTFLVSRHPLEKGKLYSFCEIVVFTIFYGAIPQQIHSQSPRLARIIPVIQHHPSMLNNHSG